MTSQVREVRIREAEGGHIVVNGGLEFEPWTLWFQGFMNYVNIAFSILNTLLGLGETQVKMWSHIWLTFHFPVVEMHSEELTCL